MTEIISRLNRNGIEKFRTEGTGSEFNTIVSICFPPMVNAKHWKTNKASVEVSELLTVSDEALALIVLENNYKEWIEKAKGNIIDKKKRLTRYTHGGQNHNGTKKGWSMEGKKRYNEIFTAIRLERTRPTSKSREQTLMKQWDRGNRETASGMDREGSEDMDENNASFTPMTDFDFD